MPLPKEYYNIVGEGAATGISTFPGLNPPGITYPTYGGMFAEEPEPVETGNIKDLASNLLYGGISGTTWAAVDLQDKDWEQMNTMEKTGWILGEGGSLFLPIGPFGLMGKASRGVARGLGNRFTNDLIKEAGSLTADKADTILKGVNTVAKKTGRHRNDIINSLDQNVQKGLKDILGDDVGLRWVNELGIGGTAAAQAQELLVKSGSNAVRSAFKKQGLPDILPEHSDYIAGQFVKGLSEGRYVNDVAEWIERAVGGPLPEGVAKYLGMAAQDMMMMSIHSIGAGKIAEHLRGEAFDTDSALSHSAIMALAFPGIRLIPWGGKESLRNGIKAYWKSYGNTNYKQIAKLHGDDVVRSMASIMVRGGMKDVINVSKLGDIGKITMRDGTKYHGDKIEKYLFAKGDKQIPMDHVYQILGKYKSAVGNELRNKWSKNYILDLAASSPRMGLGVLAMNHAVFSSGAFNDMEGPELASHIFMSAIMTKGRGAWGRNDQISYMADFTPYFEALKLLGAKPEVLQQRMSTYTRGEIAGTYGASFATDPIGQKIEQTFDTILNRKGNRNEEGHPIEYGYGGDFSPSKHKKVDEFANVYNLIKKMRNPDMSEDSILKPRFMKEKALDELSDAIDNIQVEGGKTIKQVGWEGTLAVMSERPADRIVDIYGRMINEMAERFGIDASFDDAIQGRGRISGQRITGPELMDMDGVMTYNRILERLSSMGRADIKGEGQDISRLKGNIDEISAGIHKISDGWMDVLDAEYGGKRLYNNPYDNSYIDFIGRAGNIGTKNFIRKVMIGDTTDPDAGRLSQSMRKLFAVEDTADGSMRLRRSLDDYKFEEATSDKDSARLSEAKETLRPLFELMKQKHKVSDNPRKQGDKITVEEMGAAADIFKERFNRMPERYRENFYQEGLMDLHQTIFGLDRSDPRSVHTAKAVVDNDLGYYDGDVLRLPSRKHISAIDPSAPIEIIQKANQALDRISNVLGPNARRSEYEVMDTSRPEFATLTIEKILEVDKAIGNETIKDFLDKGIKSTNEIQFRNSNLQSKLETIQVALENAQHSFDTGTLNTKEIDLVARQIETLIDMGVKKDVVASLETNLSDMRQFLAQGDRIEDYVNKYNGRMMSVQETVKDILSKEVRSKQEVQSITNKIINLALLGKPGGGLRNTQAREAIEDFNARLLELQPDIADRSKPFSDLIIDYNESGSWTKALDVVRAVNERVVGQVLGNSRNPIISESAKQLWEKTLNRNKLDHGQRTLQTIAKDYSIVDPADKSKIDPAFINKIRDRANPNSVEDAFFDIRRRIFENNTQAEGNRLWEKFIAEDSNILADALINGKLRNTARIKSGLIEFNPEGKFRTTINDDFFDRIHINGDRNDPYDLWHLDDTITIKTYDKNRTFSLDFFKDGDPLQIQNLINNQLRISSFQADILKELKDSGFTIDPNTKQFENLQTLPVSPLIYMRPSPGSRIMFVATDANVNKLNSDFEVWYARKADYFGNKSQAQRDKFLELFGGMITGKNSSASLRLKMLLQHIDYTRTGQFDQWMQEYSKSIPDYNKVAKIESDLYKRGYLSDGGTTQRFNEKTLRWNAAHHPDEYVKDFSRLLLDNNMQYTVALLADEPFSNYQSYNESNRQTRTPFDNRRVSSEKLAETVLEMDGNPIMQSLIGKQIYDVQSGAYKSLESSMLDGAKIVDEYLGRTLWAKKGGTGEWNGAKTIMFSTGENSMLGKGFAVYIPEVSREMTDRGINLLLGESSAKSYTGKNLNGNDIIPLAHSQRNLARDWTTDIFPNITNDNMMSMNIDGLGVQFTSKNVEGINISSSMFDWQGPGHVKRAAEWMGLTNILKDSANLKSMIGEGPDFIRAVFAEKEQQGLIYTEGGMGLTAKMIDFGISSQNPLVKAQLDKVLRNEDYKMLTKVPIEYGEDNFIIPDITGQLSNPVFAELRSKVLETDGSVSMGDKVYNKAVQFGGIALPDHTARKKVKDLNEKIFVFRDENSIDHVIQHDVETSIKGNEGFNFYSPFYETYNPNSHLMATRDQGGNLISTNVEGTSFQRRMQTSDAFKNNVKTVLNEVADYIRDYNLDFVQVHQLLSGRSVTSSGQRLELTSVNADVLEKLNPSLGASVNAIPKIAKDQPVMRIDRINGPDMNGIAQVNSHDLRTTLQRDNDGDHLYSYLKIPHKLVRDYANDMGHKSDYQMLDKSISQKDINIFGIGEVGNKYKAGQNESSIGFSQYANHLSKAQKAIGSIISSRRALSWMENTGIKYKGDDFLRKLASKKDLNSDDMQVLNRMMDVFQNAVDIHGGYNRLMAENALRDYFFWGEMPADYTPPIGSLETTHSKNSVVGDSRKVTDYGHGTNKDVQRLGFNIMLRTLNKANMMANDTWDAAGSRAPEIWELKNAHRDIKSLFADPTNFIAGEIVKEISRLRFLNKKNKANVLQRQLIDEYYQEHLRDVTDMKAIDKFLKQLRKGRIKASKELWSFADKENAFEYSIGGKVLDEVMKKGIYNSPDYGDLDVSKHTSAGYVVKDLVDRVAMHRAFGRDPVRDFDSQEFEIPTMVPETEFTSNVTRVKTAVTRGHVRTILQKEHRRLSESLRYFNEEKFVNPTKLSSIESRLSDVSDSIRILDIQAAHDMVIDKKNIQLQTFDKNIRGGKNYESELKSDAMVYEINGKINKKDISKDGNPRLIDHEYEGVDIDYGNLKPIGWFKEGDKFTVRKNKSYIVDIRPIMRESSSSIEAKYSEAWKQVTGVGRIGSRNLIADPVDREIFMYEVDQLRNYLDGSYYKTIKSVKHDRTYSKDVWDFASSKEQNQIDSFMNRWRNKIEGEGSDMDNATLLMRYLLQPQVMTGKYLSDGTTEMPYYRVNKRLLQQLFSWGMDNKQINMESSIKDMIQKVEKQYRGERYEEDLMSEGYKYMNSHGYRWENLGKFANIVRSLSNGWFASPFFADIEASHNLVNRRFSDPITVRTAAGEKLRIKQRIPDNVFDKESANGKGCLY